MSKKQKIEKSLKDCFDKEIVSLKTKETFSKFDKENKDDSRSGGHGKKWKILSTVLVKYSNSKELLKNPCTKTAPELKLLKYYIKSKAKQNQEKGKSINHFI